MDRESTGRTVNRKSEAHRENDLFVRGLTVNNQSRPLPNLQPAPLSFTLNVLTYWRSFMRSSLLLTTFISVFLVFPAAADQVTLKNGDRMSGTIVKSDGKTMVLHTEYAGDVMLRFDAISTIQSDAQLHLELQ